jgi:peptidoglycan L-alanyl-D-glutamate endopeptidase CwlK
MTHSTFNRRGQVLDRWVQSALIFVLLAASGCEYKAFKPTRVSPRGRTLVAQAPANASEPVGAKPLDYAWDKSGDYRKSASPTLARREPEIIDSDMQQSEALAGASFPKEVGANQALVTVHYYSFDGRLHQGQLVVNKDVKAEVEAIFDEIAEAHFPVRQVIPIASYDWSDDKSVAKDNTSGFNYREVPATHRLSTHALGLAIDINPRENPYLDPIRGSQSVFDPSKPGTISRDGPVVAAFRRRGWSWGGTWRRGRDYQHFEKVNGTRISSSTLKP